MIVKYKCKFDLHAALSRHVWTTLAILVRQHHIKDQAKFMEDYNLSSDECQLDVRYK